MRQAGADVATDVVLQPLRLVVRRPPLGRVALQQRERARHLVPHVEQAALLAEALRLPPPLLLLPLALRPVVDLEPSAAQPHRPSHVAGGELKFARVRGAVRPQRQHARTREERQRRQEVEKAAGHARSTLVFIGSGSTHLHATAAAATAAS